MLFSSRALRTERTVELVEVVVVFVFLSGVAAMDLLILLSWCKFRLVRGKRWEEACEDSELGGLPEVRIGQGRSVLREVEGFEELESWIAVFRSTLGILV